MASELASDQVAGQILNYILESHANPDLPLPTNEAFSELFGVSRTVIRDALKKLEAQGLVRGLRGSGTYVTRPHIAPSLDQLVVRTRNDNELFIQLLETRLVIELGIADYVLERATHEQIGIMEESIAAANAALEADPAHAMQNVRERDRDFHIAYLQAAHNQPISELGGVLRQFFSLSPPTVQTPDLMVMTVSEHQAILNCIKRRDAEQLKTTLRRHLERPILLRQVAQATGTHLAELPYPPKRSRG